MGFCKVSTEGRLCHNPELRYTSNQTPVCNLLVAYEVGWGEKKHSVFLHATVWGKRAEKLPEFFSKGDPIVLHGDLDTHKWETKDGEKRERHFINVIDWNFPDQKPKGKGEEEPDPLDGLANDDDVPF